MSLLTIIDNAAGRMGLGPITSVVASTNETAQRFHKLVNESVLAIMRRHAWQVLTYEKTFVTVATEEQTNASPLPTDMDRFSDETAWNRSRTRPLVGPLNGKEWQFLKAHTTSIATDAWRIRGGIWLHNPVPEAGETIAYEYVSKLMVATQLDPTVGVDDNFGADTEVCLLDEEMITQDVMWRYRAAVGLNYAELMRNAEITIADRITRDGGRRMLDMTKSRIDVSPRYPKIPEGSWTL